MRAEVGARCANGVARGARRGTRCANGVARVTRRLRRPYSSRLHAKCALRCLWEKAVSGRDPRLPERRNELRAPNGATVPRPSLPPLPLSAPLTA